MADFPKTREEQIEMLRDPKRAHLARPAEGADPELDRLLASLKATGPAPVIESTWTPDLMGKLTGRKPDGR